MKFTRMLLKDAFMRIFRRYFDPKSEAGRKIPRIIEELVDAVEQELASGSEEKT